MIVLKTLICFFCGWVLSMTVIALFPPMPDFYAFIIAAAIGWVAMDIRDLWTGRQRESD